MKEHTAKLVEGAKKEGKMIWYSTTSLVDSQALLKGYEKKYPFIETGLVRGNGPRIMSRITTEARAKRYLWDVTVNGGMRQAVFTKKGFFAKYHSPQRKFYPEFLKDAEGYWTDMYANRIVIAYNTNLVSSQEAPKIWADLLDPKWKGKMGLPPNREAWFANMLKVWGEEKGLEYMKKLAEQDLQWRAGATLNAQLVAAGELHIGLLLYNNRIESLKAKGAPIEWVALVPIYVELHPLAVSAHAPHPNAARLFIDYVLSKEGQEIIASVYRIPSRIGVDAKVSALKCEGLKQFPFDPGLVDEYERYQKLFRKVLMKK
jgi:iron(III) transport system substrate-binding protein